MRNKRDFPVKVVTDPVEGLKADVYGHTALDACAQAVGVSNQTLSKQLNEVDGLHISLRRATAIDDFLGHAGLAKCFAARAGGVYIQLPKLDDRTTPALAAGFSALVTEFAQASTAFSDSAADGRFTRAEADRLEKELHDVYVAGQALLRAARENTGER